MRDNLALERTRLANERTFLAYVRTSLSLIAAAAVILHLFSDVGVYVAVAWFLFFCGIVVLGMGIYRFRAVNSQLQSAVQAHEASAAKRGEKND